MTQAEAGGAPDGIAWRTLGGSWAVPPAYPYERLMEEAAFIAYHFHWDVDRIMALEHGERRRWAGEISRINAQINEQSGALVTADA